MRAMEGLLAFVLAGVALTGSPGPATLSLAATGAAFGALRARLHGRDRGRRRRGDGDHRNRRHRARARGAGGRKILSLKHYLVLSQDERAVQVHSRAGDLWRERFVGAGTIELDDPPVRFEVDAIYAATDLAA